MKATNIYQTLKTKGYGTEGNKPQLPGVGSPLKKSPYKFNAGLKKAAADGKLDNNPKFKAAVESSPVKKYVSDAQRKAVHASKAEQKSPAKKKYCSSPAKKKDDGKKEIKERKASSITYDPKTKTITRTLPAKGGLLEKKVTTKVSPTKMLTPENALGGGKSKIKKAKRQAKKQQRKRAGQSCLSARYKK